MKLKVNDSYYVAEISPTDKSAYLEHLSEKQIYDQTGSIPFPYTEADVLLWIQRVSEETKKQGHSVNWAIRRTDGFLIGSIGFRNFELGKSHSAEISYWLAKPYWNQGIMTEVVKKVCEFGFENFGLIRITAYIFDFNIGSARVLEKSGFQQEGCLRKYSKKDGNFLNCYLYSILLDENN